jgi:hypothetical protein
MTLEPWARAQAEQLIAPLGDRWVHVQGVAAEARRVATVLPAEVGDLLVAAAYLHDIGYAASLNRLGFHPVDGLGFCAPRAKSAWYVWSHITPRRGLRPRSVA